MWKVINIDLQKYFIKHISSVDSHKIYITNFIHLWIEELPSVTLLQRCKVQNPLIEADPQSLIQHILSLIDGNRDDVTITNNIHQGYLYLIVKSKLADVPFTFTFNLRRMDAEELYAEVTRPLLLLVQDLHGRQNMLSSLLENKDAEIAEYKLEGVQIKRKKIETDVFKREQFVKNCLQQPLSAEVLKEPICAFSQPVCEALTAVTTQYHKTQQKVCSVSSTPPCPHFEHNEAVEETIAVPDCSSKVLPRGVMSALNRQDQLPAIVFKSEVFVPVVQSSPTCTTTVVRTTTARTGSPVRLSSQLLQRLISVEVERVTRQPGPIHPAPLPGFLLQGELLDIDIKLPPPKPDIKLGKSTSKHNKPGIVLSWNMHLGSVHEMIASYELFAYQEGKHPPSTKLWKRVGEVEARPLPMACTLTNFTEGYKYHFAVRAIDIYKRYGPFSTPGNIDLVCK